MNNKVDNSFNEKRKWQIALRRYIINKSKGVVYAPYFGIDITGFRYWIECQFDKDMNWENFSTVWQFEHMIPVAFFDLCDTAELHLCWSFLNIRAEKISLTSKIHKATLNNAKDYFETLHQHSGLHICKLLINKIVSISHSQLLASDRQLQFLKEKAGELEMLNHFSAYEFERLNSGDTVNNLIAEQELMKKYG